MILRKKNKLEFRITMHEYLDAHEKIKNEEKESNAHRKNMFYNARGQMSSMKNFKDQRGQLCSELGVEFISSKRKKRHISVSPATAKM